MGIRYRGWKRGRARVFELVAIGSTLLLLASLAFVTVTLTQPSHPSVPAQQSGTAAGFPHRTSALADTGRIQDGRVVSATAGPGEHLAGPAPTREVPGAVGPAVKPRPLTFPVQGKASEKVRVLAKPATPKLRGYNPTTSQQLALTSADEVTYANADGTMTSFTYQSPVNYRSAGGQWTPISTTLVPAGQASTTALYSAPASAP